MTIRNNVEMQMFENVIDRCSRPLWLVTSEGEQINLKTPAGRTQGIKKMMNAAALEEPELFASCHEDEMVVFEYIAYCRQAA